MLPADNRLRRPEDFRSTFRDGVSVGTNCVVVHLALLRHEHQDTMVSALKEPVLAGFVVSKKVGNSVIRHRVKRQLRHILRERLAEVPAGARVVVRARPAAVAAPYGTLAKDVDTALGKAIRRGSTG